MWRYFFTSLILILLLAACGEDAPADTVSPTPEYPTIRVTVGEARVFDYPSRDANILFTLIEGDRTNILARTVPDELDVVWYQVGRGELFGWIAGSQVETIGDIDSVREVALQDDVPTLSPETPAPTATPTSLSAGLPDVVFGIVSVSQAAVFDEPNREALNNTQLFEGEQVDIIGRLPDDEFYLVAQDSNILGWMLAAQIEIDGDLEKVPFLEDAGGAISELIGVDSAALTTPTDSPASATPTNQVAPSATAVPLQADSSAEPAPADGSPTATPLFTYTFTPSPTADFASTARAAATATLLPPAFSPTPTLTAAIQEGVPPPLTLDLPSGWQFAHILVPIRSIYLNASLPVSIYQGPLEGDVFGTLWIAWGFPNVTGQTGEINLYADGIQLLRGVILDSETCQIGLGAERRQYFVGEYDATGTIFSAVNCADSTDIAGFFAALEVGGGSFAFFAAIEPTTSTDIGLPQMQAILDTVVFEVGE